MQKSFKQFVKESAGSEVDLDFTKLTPVQLYRILDNSGYSGSKILRASYKGNSSSGNSFRYFCVWDEEDDDAGGNVQGDIYVSVSKSGKIEAEFGG